MEELKNPVFGNNKQMKKEREIIPKTYRFIAAIWIIGSMLVGFMYKEVDGFIGVTTDSMYVCFTAIACSLFFRLGIKLGLAKYKIIFTITFLAFLALLVSAFFVFTSITVIVSIHQLLMLVTLIILGYLYAMFFRQIKKRKVIFAFSIFATALAAYNTMAFRVTQQSYHRDSFIRGSHFWSTKYENDDKIYEHYRTPILRTTPFISSIIPINRVVQKNGKLLDIVYKGYEKEILDFFRGIQDPVFKRTKDYKHGTLIYYRDSVLHYSNIIYFGNETLQERILNPRHHAFGDSRIIHVISEYYFDNTVGFIHKQKRYFEPEGTLSSTNKNEIESSVEYEKYRLSYFKDDFIDITPDVSVEHKLAPSYYALTTKKIVPTVRQQEIIDKYCALTSMNNEQNQLDLILKEYGLNPKTTVPHLFNCRTTYDKYIKHLDKGETLFDGMCALDKDPIVEMFDGLRIKSYILDINKYNFADTWLIFKDSSNGKTLLFYYMTNSMFITYDGIYQLSRRRYVSRPTTAEQRKINENIDSFDTKWGNGVAEMESIALPLWEKHLNN